MNTRERPNQLFFGKYPGMVVNNEPQEGAKHRGELLVLVTGLLEEVAGGQEYRSMEVVAKPCFPPGFFFVPENDDLVWVEFVGGDINEAVWVGVWYPVDRPPKTVEAENPTEFQKIIRTVSGQVIQLDDTDGSEQIVITDEKNKTKITINADGITVESADKAVNITCKEVTVKADEMTLDGKVTITGETAIKAKLTVGSGPTTIIENNEIKGA